MTIDFEKLYNQAKNMAGDCYKDLVHMSYEEMTKKDRQLKDPESYLFMIMRNQINKKDSRFNKLYGRQKKAEFDCEEVQHKEADIVRVKEIMHEMRTEGLFYEVWLFEQYAQKGNCLAISRASGINRRTIEKIIKFVKEEIKRRYAN